MFYANSSRWPRGRINLREIEHMRERVARLEQAITEAVRLASPALQQVINDLQLLRGIADILGMLFRGRLSAVHTVITHI